MNRLDEILDEISYESELNQVLTRELAESRESHREVMARSEQLGVRMREQTEALIRARSGLNP